MFLKDAHRNPDAGKRGAIATIAPVYGRAEIACLLFEGGMAKGYRGIKGTSRFDGTPPGSERKRFEPKTEYGCRRPVKHQPGRYAA